VALDQPSVQGGPIHEQEAGVNFLEGIDLTDAARRSLIADLELRRKDERVADRFFRYAYKGGADLVLQHGEFWKGRVRPERYDDLVGEPGRCYGTSLRACQADSNLAYVEGYCTTSAGLPISHGWCVERDTGEIVDLVLPCGADQLGKYLHSSTRLDILHPSRWAYMGVRFTTELVLAHDRTEGLGLPLLDRSMAEATSNAARDDAELYADDSDKPILRVTYNPNRTELPA